MNNLTDCNSHVILTEIIKEGNVWMSDIVTETIIEYSLKA